VEKKLNLVFYRNLLTREYLDIEDADVFDAFERIITIKNFVDIIKLIIKEKIN